jgi:hypothetical protein
LVHFKEGSGELIAIDEAIRWLDKAGIEQIEEIIEL